MKSPDYDLHHRCRRKAATAYRQWLVVPESSPPYYLEEAGKQSIMKLTGLPARDLRVLDPLLSYPSTILGRERAIVVNLEHIRAVVTATEVLIPNSKDPMVASFVCDMECKVSGLNAAEQGGAPPLQVHSKKRNRLSHDKMEKLVYVKFNSEIEAKFANRKRDPLLAPSMDEGRVVEWIDPPRTSVESETDDEVDDEVFPGEQLRWRDVEKAMGVDPRPRSSSRQRAAKKAKRSHGIGASSSKGKRIIEQEDRELEPSLDSNDDTSTSESESEDEQENED